MNGMWPTAGVTKRFIPNVTGSMIHTSNSSGSSFDWSKVWARDIYGESMSEMVTTGDVDTGFGIYNGIQITSTQNSDNYTGNILKKKVTTINTNVVSDNYSVNVPSYEMDNGWRSSIRFFSFCKTRFMTTSFSRMPR